MTAHGMVLLGYVIAMGGVILFMCFTLLRYLWLRLSTPRPGRLTINADVDVSLTASSRALPAAEPDHRAG